MREASAADRAPGRGMSLRFRLTLWVLAIFAVIQLTLVLILSLYQRSSINRYFDERLLARVEAMVEQIAPEMPDVNSDRLTQIDLAETRFVLFEAFALVLYDEDGAIIATNLETPPAAAPDWVEEALATGGPVFHQIGVEIFDQPNPDARMARAVVLAFAGADGERHALLAATSDTYARRMLALASRLVLVGLPIGLIAAAAAGWFIAGIAVSPLQSLNRFARELSPESLSRSVTLDEGGAEVERLQSELNAARERIVSGFRGQERFLSNVSHELKTPIATILTEAQTLRGLDAASPEVREFVESVKAEMQRLGRLIDSFLLLARVRGGRPLQVSSSLCLVNEFIMDSVANCGSLASSYDVTMRPHLLDDWDGITLTVVGVADLLQAMLDNLLRNAIRFSPAGGRVEVAAQYDDECVRIEVRDQGPGIPVEIIDRIFDRFAQAPSEERRGRGHGLGLEIAQGIAEMHGGVIRVANRDEGGCCFTISLPRSMAVFGDSGVGGAAPDDEVEDHAEEGQKKDDERP